MPLATHDCDVLVVGLGPVGQLLTNLLGRLGVRALGLDAAPEPVPLPRAAVIDDEVLRILQGIGLDAAVLAGSGVHDRASYVTAGGRRVAVLDASRGPLGHPPLVSIHQPSMERSLVAGLAALGSVEARWGVTVERLVERDDGVEALLDDGSSVRARWVVACDGGRSPVRTALGIGFGGSTFAQRWLVVDARVDRPLARVPHPLFVGDPARPIVTLPMGPGRHRWEWMLRPGEDGAPLLARAGELMAPWLEGERVEVERSLVYTFHSRTAERWRSGHVLLAGDAAHVMPPFAGQGFSSGARDVANLAWKLDAVLRGAPDALLDTYEAERRPHVRAMQQLAVRWGAVVQTTRPRAARARDAVMTTLDGSPVQDWLLANAKPPATAPRGAFAERPRRLPPRRTVGALFPQPRVGAPGGAVLLDDALPAGWVALTLRAPVAGTFRAKGVPVMVVGADLEDVEGVLGAWLRRARADWVLLRPDRYVFACGRAGQEPAALTSLAALLGRD